MEVMFLPEAVRNVVRPTRPEVIRRCVLPLWSEVYKSWYRLPWQTAHGSEMGSALYDPEQVLARL